MSGLELEQLGKSACEIREMLVQVYKWVTCFSEGRGVTDKEGSGWPAICRTEENIAKVRQILRENCWLTVRSTAEQVNINR
jgi:hypothetical protein